jgi:hypothetical protein
MKKLLFFLVAVLLALTASSSYASSLIWGVDPSGTNELVNLNPWTGAELQRFNITNISSTDTNIGLAGWSNQLFYINGNFNPGLVQVISPSDGSVTNSFDIAGGWNVNGLGYYSGSQGSYLYTSGCSVGDMHRYVAADGSGPTYYWGNSLQNRNAVGGDAGGRIFTTLSSGSIAEVDPLVNQNPINTFAAPQGSSTIVGMAFDGIYLYASDLDDHLYILNPDTGAVLNTITTRYTLYALGSTEGVVPLPPTVLLLGSGLLGLAGWRRFRKT